MAKKKTKGGKSRPANRPKPAAEQRAKPPGEQAKSSAKPSVKPGAESSAERAKPTRAERIEAAQRARQRKSLYTRLGIAGGVVLVAVVIGALVFSNRMASQRTIDSLEARGCDFDRESDEDFGAGRNHSDNPPPYAVNPPSGGNHTPQASPAGIYTPESLPADGQVVHAMEHGYVVLWYKPDVAENVLDDLRALTRKYSKDTLLVPRASLPRPAAATTWHKRLLCAQPDLKAFDKFITSYRNQGPEKVPHD